KSLRHAARFCSVFSTVCNQFRPGRHALSASNFRTVMRRRWREWDGVSEATAVAGAAGSLALKKAVAVPSPTPDPANNLTIPLAETSHAQVKPPGGRRGASH